jgi:hypothetical protein
MHAIISRRTQRAAVAVMAVAALASVGVGAVGVGSAHADTNWAPTYTCDTLTILGNNLGGAGLVVVKDAGNCVASNGAPTSPAGQIDANPVSLVARSGGTAYHCTSGYLGFTIVDLPAYVEGLVCVPASWSANNPVVPYLTDLLTAARDEVNRADSKTALLLAAVGVVIGAMVGCFSRGHWTRLGVAGRWDRQ